MENSQNHKNGIMSERKCLFCGEPILAEHGLRKYCPEKHGKKDYCKYKHKALKKCESLIRGGLVGGCEERVLANDPEVLTLINKSVENPPEVKSEAWFRTEVKKAETEKTIETKITPKEEAPPNLQENPSELIKQVQVEKAQVRVPSVFEILEQFEIYI